MENQANKQNMSLSYMLKVTFNMLPEMGRIILTQDSMQNLLKSNSTFDLIITTYPLSDGFFGLSHHFNAPIILFSPPGANVFINNIAGNINLYSHVPTIFSPLTEDMTFFERVLNTLCGLASEALNTLMFYPQLRDVHKKYFPDAPPLDKLYDNIALTLVNSHFSTESPRPYTPNMIPIGGFNLQEIEPLPKDLQKYLDDSRDGVIYFSLGTIVKSSVLPNSTIKIFMKSFSQIKQNVLWKFEADLPEKPRNVRIEKWLPQKSVLGKIRLGKYFF